MYWNEYEQQRLESLIGLTLTWDVLKLSWLSALADSLYGLTLTWDVLKSNNDIWKEWEWLPININMRCIEI